ncbi:MAG: hypothetical protein QXI77_02920 [Nanopusillaceae archaeon]
MIIEGKTIKVREVIEVKPCVENLGEKPKLKIYFKGIEGEAEIYKNLDGIYILQIWRHKSKNHKIIPLLIESLAGKKVKEIPEVIQVKISEQEYNTIKEEQKKIEKERQETIWKDFLENGVEVIWHQNVSDIDFPTIALDEWNLYSAGNLLSTSYVSKEDLKRVFLYAKAKNLLKERKRIYRGYSEVELIDYSLHLTFELLEKARMYKTEEEIKKIKKEIQELKNLLSNEEKLLKKIFVSRVHVTEDGYFSDCDPYCDDCFWREYIVSPYWQSVQNEAECFYVKGKKKTYKYFIPTPEILMKLKKIYADIVEKEKQKIEKELEMKEKELKKAEEIILDNISKVKNQEIKFDLNKKYDKIQNKNIK